MSISRRAFLKSSAAATALSVAGGAAKTVLAEPASSPSAPGNKWPGVVAVNFNKNAVTGTLANPQVDQAVVTQMVDDCIKMLTGESTVGAAWKKIFPSGLSATSSIAIKTEFYNNTLVCPHWSSLLAITKGLAQMDFGGTPFTGKITIFESNTPNTFESAGYKTDTFQGVSLVKDSQQTYNDAATGETKYSTSLKNADFLICVFGCRGHSEYAEYVTLGWKNMWGVYPADMAKHGVPAFSVRCANMMSTGAVNKKLVLSVCSALFANNENNAINTGPQSFAAYAKKIDSTATSAFAPCTIIMSTDAVSTEMQAIKIMRLNKDKNSGVNDMPKYLRACAGISGALSVTYNIGVIDEEKMDIRKMINGVAITPVTAKQTGKTATDYSLRVTPLRGQRTVFMEYAIPASQQGERVVLSVYDMLGNLVFSQDQTVTGVLNHFSWDCKTSQGRMLGRGKYACKLTIGKINRSAAFSIV